MTELIIFIVTSILKFQAALGGSGSVDLRDLGDGELQSLLGNMSQQQLVQLFSGAGLGGLANSGLLSNRSGNSTSSPSSRERGGSSSTAPEPAAATSTEESTTPSSRPNAPSSEATSAAAGNVPIQLMDLQSVLSGIKVPSSKEPSVDLSSGITGEVIKPLLNNPEFVKKMKDLLPPSEEASDTASEISSTVSSPQFKQALQLFSSGLQSGQLGPLINEFGLGDAAVAAASSGNMEAFIKAVNDSKSNKKDQSPDKSSEGDPKEKKGKDDDFALD